MLFKYLSGRKTHIVAILIALATFAQYMGWIDQKIFEALLGLLGALGLSAMRNGVAEEVKKVTPPVQVVQTVPAPTVLK